MIARFGTAPRRIGLDIETFQAHWRGRHGELAAGLPGVTRYWQNHAILRDGENLLPWPGFDACSQIEFDNLATMDAGFASEHALVNLRPDEDYLVDRVRGGQAVTTRVKFDGRIDMDGVRLLTFLRLAPLRALASLGEALTALPVASTAIGREVFLALDGRAAAQRASIFDAIDILWFETPALAERHAYSAEARERQHELADLARGSERLIAKIHVIV